MIISYIHSQCFIFCKKYSWINETGNRADVKYILLKVFLDLLSSRLEQSLFLLRDIRGKRTKNTQASAKIACRVEV